MFQRARVIFKCTDATSRVSFQHDANFNLEHTVAPYVKLILIDSVSRNVLTLGIRRENAATAYLAFVKYEFASPLSPVAVPTVQIQSPYVFSVDPSD